MGRALSSRPAHGEDPGYGLRLRARGTGGAVAPRVKPRTRSAARCALDGRADPRFQPLWTSRRPSWS
jgi:hypothetical protein